MRFAPILCLMLGMLGCSESTPPIGPTPPVTTPPSTPQPQPKPPSYPPESWTLTASITSVTPHRCWRDLTGLTYDFALIVRRAEAMRLLVYWDPTDGIEYVAAGGQVEVILTGRVSGRFSDDGRSISAEEVLSYLASEQARRSMFVIAGPPLRPRWSC